MKKLLVILISAVSFNGMAQDNPKHLNVLAVNGLNMRSQPDTKARVVTKVAYGKRVEVMQKTKVELQLGWVKDHWYKVKYRGREGFIFGGYLTELKSPMELKSQRLSDLLLLYATQNLTSDSAPIETIETDRRGDTLKHTLVTFENGLEMELEDDSDSHTAILILSASVQDTYVLLEALLKRNGMEGQLDNLWFVQNSNEELIKVINAAGTISLKEYADGQTSLKLKSYKLSN